MPRGEPECSPLHPLGRVFPPNGSCAAERVEATMVYRALNWRAWQGAAAQEFIASAEPLHQRIRAATSVAGGMSQPSDSPDSASDRLRRESEVLRGAASLVRRQLRAAIEELRATRQQRSASSRSRPGGDEAAMLSRGSRARRRRGRSLGPSGLLAAGLLDDAATDLPAARRHRRVGLLATAQRMS